MRVIVTGVPGVGKSSVMDGAAKAKGLKVVNYGSVMLDVAKRVAGVKDRDEMRRMPMDINRRVQVEAAEQIYAMGDVIVDTHATIKTPKGYWPGLPVWVLDKLRPDTIVLVEADPTEVHARRSADPSRARDADTAETIREHQEMNRAAAMAYAALTGATVKIVMNRQGQVERAVEEMLRVL